ncbi:MAG: serine/threonine-protein kinase [Pseudomonadota bacterium]
MKIGRYEILEEIGQGAMGTVYRARDPLIERTVAIKTVDIAQLRHEGADAEARFLREAQSAGRLSHPNIVTIYDVGETDSLAYIAMEYLSGPTLREVLDHARMPLDLALDTARQMAEALAFAHAHGVIHRDVKPSNVVVTGHRGQIKLTDFGIAHLANSEQTQTGQMLGSPRYMSPEQVRGGEIDGRSDIFSLGAVLYEMLTGHHAFDGDSLATIVYRVVHDAPVDPARLRPGLPAGLVELLGRMLSKSPQHRPDAPAVVAALHALATSAAATRPRADNRVPRLLPVVAFGAPVAVFLIVGVGIIVIEHFLDPGRQAALATPGAAAHTPAPTPAAGTPTLQAPREAQASAPPPKKTAAPEDPYLAGLERKQVELRLRRTELLLTYTAQHPDVAQIDRQLAQLRAERQRYLRQLRRGQDR